MKITIEQLKSLLESGDKNSIYQALNKDWLNSLIPGIRDMVGCEQAKTNHAEGDVGRHTALVIENLRKVALSRLARNADLIELLSALLHDLKKPLTKQIEADGYIRFPKHEEEAVKEIPEIARRLALSQAEVDKLLFLVARHTQSHQWKKLSPEEQKELCSYPWTESLALLQEADALSCLHTDGGYHPSFWEEIMAFK